VTRRLRVDRRAGLLLAGVLVGGFLALGGSVALPASDPALSGEAPERSRLEARGMEVYRNEGCWYCHTLYRRSTATDSAAGAPLPPDAYLGLSPAMLGHERTGPDLTGPSGDEAGLVAYLRDPRGRGGRTAMPSYAYLGEEDLRALAAYLLSFR
jgi:cbb3-type cytochrome oxidase cytochrome c subunit